MTRIRRDELHLPLHSPPLLAELEDVAEVFRRQVDRRVDDRFLDMVELHRFRESGGLSTSRTVPSIFTARYPTVGEVVMSSMSYSRSSRSWMISMWSSPRNPHRKPNPSATELSGSP